MKNQLFLKILIGGFLMLFGVTGMQAQRSGEGAASLSGAGLSVSSKAKQGNLVSYQLNAADYATANLRYLSTKPANVVSVPIDYIFPTLNVNLQDHTVEVVMKEGVMEEAEMLRILETILNAGTAAQSNSPSTH